MPLGGPFLDQATIDTVKSWIDAGAQEQLATDRRAAGRIRRPVIRLPPDEHRLRLPCMGFRAGVPECGSTKRIHRVLPMRHVLIAAALCGAMFWRLRPESRKPAALPSPRPTSGP